ncbi:MAG: TlpA family protein disulfide reductase [Acidimicrobiales bacterium]
MDDEHAESQLPRTALGRRLRWLIPLALLGVILMVVALIEAHNQTRQLSNSGTIQSAGFYPPKSSSPPDFSLPALQGARPDAPVGPTNVTMSSLLGTPIVINMWSSSCSVCKQETPAMETVARHAGDAVTFVGVDTADQKATALAFLSRYDVSYLQLFDPSEQVGTKYGIWGLPDTVFVSAHGKVVGEYVGALSVTSLTHYLRTLFSVHLRPS